MLEFVRRNRIVLTSGGLLLLSLLLLSTGARTGQPTDPLGRLVLEVMRPLQGAVAAGWDSVTGFWRNYISLVGVREENERLRRRILELEQQAVRIAEVELTDRRLGELLRFRSRLDGDVQAAQIIGRDPFPSFGTVIISKGEADGVRKSMAVLSQFGVVGQIMTTSAHSSRVLLITDHNSGVDALVQRTRARGIVEGSLDGRCIMKYLKREEDVEDGDRIVTSGLDGIFPKGILVGEVAHVTRGTRGLLQVAEVHPTVPLDRIEEVLVVGSGSAVKDAPAPSAADISQSRESGAEAKRRAASR
jgi:rod shape-determining protein MreC